MNVPYTILVASCTTATLLFLSSVVVSPAGGQDASVAPSPKPASAGAADMQSTERALEKINERLVALEHTRLMTDSSDARATRLESELATLRYEVSQLAEVAADGEPAAVESPLFEDEARIVDEDEQRAEYERRRDDAADAIEAAIATSPRAPDLASALELRIADLAGEEMLAGTRFLASDCSEQHCRLEFGHDDQQARDELVANIALLLPSGTSSLAMPIEHDEGTHGSIVYLGLAVE